MTAWVLLGCAIVAEVTATLALRGAIHHRVLYAVVAVGYVAAFVLLTLTLKAGLGIGLTYAVWAGLGVAATAVGSKVIFDEPLNVVMACGMALIIGGVALVEIGASH